MWSPPSPMFPGLRSRRRSALRQTPIPARRSTASKLCHSRLYRDSRATPRPAHARRTDPVVIPAAGPIHRSRRTVLAFVAFMILSGPAVNAQDFVRKASDYMNAQVEINHFQGSILVARNGEVLVKGSYESANDVIHGRSTK